jgi:hypothetical protein
MSLGRQQWQAVLVICIGELLFLTDVGLSPRTYAAAIC